MADLARHDGAELEHLQMKPSSLGSIPEPTTNCRIGVSQARCHISKCGISLMGIKPGVPFAAISWWTLKISRCLSAKIRQVIAGTLDKL